jgi:endonuclease YncB( thermonuclease family)
VRRRVGRRWRFGRTLRWLAIGAGALVLIPQVSDVALGLRPVTNGCRVAYVVDGDTVDFNCPGEGLMRARITGFDAPELYSPQCAGEAAAALASQAYLRWTLATAGQIKVVLGGTDRWDRRLAEVFVDGERLADRMIAAGHGRGYDGGARAGWCA